LYTIQDNGTVSSIYDVLLHPQSFVNWSLFKA